MTLSVGLVLARERWSSLDRGALKGVNGNGENFVAVMPSPRRMGGRTRERDGRCGTPAAELWWGNGPGLVIWALDVVCVPVYSRLQRLPHCSRMMSPPRLPLMTLSMRL